MNRVLTVVLLFGFQSAAFAAETEPKPDNKVEASAEAAENKEGSSQVWETMNAQEREKYLSDLHREEQMMVRDKPDPQEVICIKRTARIGSRVMRNVCKTRAEFRLEQAQQMDELLASGRLDNGVRTSRPLKRRIEELRR